MSKIQTIKIENFKAISELYADFKGCTAIVTGGNNKGKTSFLRGIPERVRFNRPSVMVKEGSTQGRGEMTLDSGERFVWEFNTDGKDTLQYISKEGSKRNVTVELGKKYFPPLFDIDSFLMSSPKEQSKTLQKIVGIDFMDIDKRYAEAYAIRTDKNRQSEKYQVKLTEMMEVPPCEFVDLAKLQAQKEEVRAQLNDTYLANKKANEEMRAAWQKEVDAHRAKVSQNDLAISQASNRYNEATEALNKLQSLGYTGNDATDFVSSLKSAIPAKIEAVEIVEPEYINELPDDTKLKEIDALIFDAVKKNAEAQAYKDYVEYKASVEKAKIEAKDADDAVKAIEAERANMIASANFPKGIAITPEGITVDGLPLDRAQISTSKLYTTALRIAAMNIGDVRTLFFDASYLDKNTLTEIQTWASENDLQLLIERPDFDGGEITYSLICDNN
jgi:AAA15 family ATPase/GTPase